MQVLSLSAIHVDLAVTALHIKSRYLKKKEEVMSTGLYGDDTSGLQTLHINGIEVPQSAESAGFYAGELYATKQSIAGFGYRIYVTDKEFSKIPRPQEVQSALSEILDDQGWEWNREHNPQTRRTESYLQPK